MMFFFKLEGLLLPLFLVFIIMVGFVTALEKSEFIYTGFKDSNLLNRDGVADITPNGLLRLTNFDSIQQMGHAIYSDPIKFKNSPSDGNTSNSTADTKVFSFSTTFVFQIIPFAPESRGQGIAFFIAPQRGLPGGQSSQFLGLFNATNIGNPANHVLAVELDTNQNPEYNDIDGNHVGIDINNIISNISKTAGYSNKPSGGDFLNLNLVNQKLQVWIEYDGGKKQLDVTLAPLLIPKPYNPLLSLRIDLSPILLDNMYVGFSSSLGNYRATSYIFGWSFKINGEAQELSQLPDLPVSSTGSKAKRSVSLAILIILCVINILFTF